VLLGNYSVLNKNPGREFGGSTVSNTRPQFGKSGPARGRFTGGGWSAASGGTPAGGRPPITWIIAISRGGVAARGDGTSTGTVNLAGGKAIVATGAGSSIGTAVGGLIVQIVAAGAGSSTGIGSLGAVLAIVAAGAGSSAGTATAKGSGRIVALGAGTSVGAVDVNALGQIIASSADAASTLTADQVAAAVWATAAATGAPGSMGEAVNVAHLLLRNKTVTDPTAGTITVYDTDGTTVLFVADLFADADGTTPYTGAGAERRERLE
jgi:hypothetical protein